MKEQTILYTSITEGHHCIIKHKAKFHVPSNDADFHKGFMRFN